MSVFKRLELTWLCKYTRLRLFRRAKGLVTNVLNLKKSVFWDRHAMKARSTQLRGKRTNAIPIHYFGSMRARAIWVSEKIALATRAGGAVQLQRLNHQQSEDRRRIVLGWTKAGGETHFPFAGFRSLSFFIKDLCFMKLIHSASTMARISVLLIASASTVAERSHLPTAYSSRPTLFHEEVFVTRTRASIFIQIADLTLQQWLSRELYQYHILSQR